MERVKVKNGLMIVHLDDYCAVSTQICRDSA